KVARHPVEDDADALRVAAVDEPAEVVRAAEAAGGREEPRGLVAPGRIQRMLGHRQELDMGEAEVLHVRDELAGEIAVVQESAVRAAPPGTRVHLVDGDGRMLPAALRTLPEPAGIRPRERRRFLDARRRRGAALE